MKLKLIMFLLCLSPMIVTDEGKEFNIIKILVYNTHGLPEIFIDDNPKFRFPIIGSKTKAYDIAKDLRSSGFENIIVKPLEDDLKYYNTEQIRDIFYG